MGGGVLAFALWRVVFNPTLVKDVITDEVITSDLIPAALAWFSEQRALERVAKGEALTGIEEPDIPLLLSYLDIDDWRTIKAEILPDEILTQLVAETVDDAYAWIDSSDRVPNIVWSLQPLLDRVNGEHGVNAIATAYAALPECTQQEIDDFLGRLGSAPPNTEVLYNLCQFPEPWRADQLDDYVKTLEKLTANFPPQFALTDQLARLDESGGVGPAVLKQQLRLIRLIGMFAWAFPLALALVLLALTVRSLPGLGRWLGWPLLVGGALALAPTLAYQPLLIGVLASGVLSETPEPLTGEARHAVLRLAGEVFQPLLTQATMVIVIGAVLVVLGAALGGTARRAR